MSHNMHYSSTFIVEARRGMYAREVALTVKHNTNHLTTNFIIIQ